MQVRIGNSKSSSAFSMSKLCLQTSKNWHLAGKEGKHNDTQRGHTGFHTIKSKQPMPKNCYGTSTYVKTHT